jgi:hypothetical protein
MENRFPGCWAYLNARREELQTRKITGGLAAERQWYQYGRSQSLTKFNDPKIIFPVLSVEPRYAYDDANTLFTGGGNGPYYMVRARDCAGITNLYLLAILNHPFSEALVRTKTSPFRGGYYSHGKQFIENLPVPIPTENERTEIDALVTSLIAVFDELSGLRIPRERQRKMREAIDLRADIENRVSAILGLSPADLAALRAVPVPE